MPLVRIHSLTTSAAPPAAAIIKFHNDVEYKVDFVLAANEKKDLVKLAIKVPGGMLEPGTWLEIDPNQPNIADKVIVIGTPMGLGFVNLLRCFNSTGTIRPS